MNALAAALRAKVAQSGPTAPLAGIFDYIDNQGSGASFVTPNEHDGGEAGWGSTAPVPWTTQTQGGGDNASTSQMPGVDPRFAGVVSFLSNGSNGEGSGGWQSRVDGSKLPTTRFGDINLVAPVNAHSSLYNPAMVYDDPNYGRITDARNVRPDQLNATVGMALPAAAMAGIGYLAAPAAIAGGGLFGGAFNPAQLGLGLVNAARGFGGGTSGGLSGLLGALGGGFGLPSWMTTAGRLALAQALRNRGG